jgi:hypothetical protein
MIDPEHKKILLQRFESFLNLNYNCECTDPECSNNLYEAIVLVEIIEEVFAMGTDHNDITN